jgi:flagellar L-ring protein FlgH
MKKRLALMLTGVCLMGGGCITNPPVINKTHYDNLPSARPVERTMAPGSLWPGETNGNMVFADNKATYENDIITIIVDETAVAQNSASTNTARATSSDSKISAMLGIDSSILKSNPMMGGQIGAGGSSTSTMKNTGDTNRGNKLQAKIAGRVVRKLQNGNLLVEGRRQVTINAEDQFIVITGIVRPADVSADNYVYSQNIADMRVVYTGAGVLHDKSYPGWGTRILDWAWPF